MLKSSEPYFAGNTPRWNTPSYDVLARNVGLAAADPTLDSSVVFNDLGVTTTDAAGREREIVNNALGQTIRSYEIDDSSGGLAITQFDYSVVGNLERTSKYTLGGGSSEIAKTVATYDYDRLGRRLEMNDPDLGLIDTVYNSVSEVIQEQTPRLRAYSSSLYREMAYDKLSRLIERTDPTDDLSDVITTAYEYDDTYVSGVGIGRLTSETITDENSIVTFDRAYYYDSAIGGRMTDVATTIGAETFVTSRDYDDLGRLATVTYPVTPSYSTAFAVDYVYNPRGYLERVEDAATSEVLYQTTDVNEMGQIEENYLGDTSLTNRTYIPGTGRLVGTNAARDNSGTEDIQNLVYSYDALGNMSMRSDLLRAVSETFTYDDFNRLTSATVDNGVDTDVVDFDYDDLGSLTHKSDITTLTSSSMSYAMSGNAGTHALTSLNDGISSPFNFTYDVNGNLLSGDADNNSRTMTWNSYDKVASITQGAVSHEFEYGPDRARYQHTANDGSGDDVTIYVENLYTRTEFDGGAEDHKLNVYVNGSVIAIVLDDEDTGSGSVENRYLHRDHLGSITALVDGASGSSNIEWMAYDVFGKRRDAIDWIGAAATPTEVRGYTGHEHLDDVNIIHMNGRIYDPQLGRMASPDPMLQDPMNSQNFNRYSYVMNNPLKYTDPTGYCYGLDFGSGCGGFNSYLTSLLASLGDWGRGGGCYFDCDAFYANGKEVPGVDHVDIDPTGRVTLKDSNNKPLGDPRHEDFSSDANALTAQLEASAQEMFRSEPLVIGTPGIESKINNPQDIAFNEEFEAPQFSHSALEVPAGVVSITSLVGNLTRGSMSESFVRGMQNYQNNPLPPIITGGCEHTPGCAIPDYSGADRVAGVILDSSVTAAKLYGGWRVANGVYQISKFAWEVAPRNVKIGIIQGFSNFTEFTKGEADMETLATQINNGRVGPLNKMPTEIPLQID